MKLKSKTNGKEFESIDEIIVDEIFIKHLQKNINNLWEKRRQRPAAPEGCYYKRDWFGRIEDRIGIRQSSFLDKIKPIWEHRSTLPGEPRRIIESICNNALRETLNEYSKLK